MEPVGRRTGAKARGALLRHGYAPARGRWGAVIATLAVHALAVLAVIAGARQTASSGSGPGANPVVFSIPAQPRPPQARSPAEKHARERSFPALHQTAQEPPRTAPATLGNQIAAAAPAASASHAAVLDEIKASPAVRPPPPAEAEAPLAAYKRDLWRHIASKRPRGIRLSGTTLVRFRITRNGALISSEVTGPSGNMNLDKLALRAVRMASPFPVPPATLAEEQLVFTVPMNFR